MQRAILLIICFLVRTVVGQTEAVIPVFQNGHYAKINELQFHSDNRHLVTCADDGKLIVWDIYLGLQYGSHLVDESGLRTFDFLSDSVLITLSNIGLVQAWSFPGLTPLTNAVQPVSDALDLTTVNDSTIVLVGNGVHLYEPFNKAKVTLDYTSKGRFTTVTYEPERDEITVLGPVDNYSTTISIERPMEFKRYVLGSGRKAIYPNAENLLIAATDGSLVYVDLLKEKKRIFTLKDNHNYVSDMDMINEHIAVSGTFGFATVFSKENHEILTTIGLNGVALSALDYSPNEAWLAIANNDGTIMLYETEGYKLNRVLKGASASVTDVKVYGEDLFVGYSDGILRWVNLPDNKIQSNSIKMDAISELLGINYAILSIDTLVNSRLYFTALKIDRHHERNNLLRSVKKIRSVWDLNKNEIILQKEVEDIALRIEVDRKYHAEIPYTIEQYTTVINAYNFEGNDFITFVDQSHFIRVNDADTLVYPTKHQAPIAGLRFLSKYQLILSFSRDGSMRFWDLEGNYLAALFLSGQYGFTYWNPDNYYFSSKEMLEKVGFIYQGDLYSYEQFDVFYNRPKAVMENLSYFVDEDVDDYEKAYYKRLQNLGVNNSALQISKNLPVLKVDYEGGYSTKETQVVFQLEMNGNGSQLASYSYRVNGIESKIDLSRVMRLKTEVEIALAAGLNQVEFFCTTTSGVKSLIQKMNITCEKRFKRPELYMVSIGVSDYQDKAENLEFAQKDAEEIGQLMQKNKRFKTVHELTLVNANFTRDKLAEIKAFLAPAAINDVVVLYYAGHGVLDANFDYFLATYDMNFDEPEEKGIAFDEVETFVEELTCRNKLIMLDACFSGELDKTVIRLDSIQARDEEQGNIEFRSSTLALLDGGGEMGIFELAKMTFIDLDKSRGTNILSSASGIEYAMESEAWQNGLFTFVLKDGLLNKKADLNGDKLIRITELQIYLRETVSNLSNGEQNPIMRKENRKNDFVIW